MNQWIQKVLEGYSLQGNRLANRLLARSNFIEKHNRKPRNPFSAKATFEDYIFQKMIGPWTPFEESCVDKESAKATATKLSSRIKTTPTITVFPISSDYTLEKVGSLLYPYIGKNILAKCTHASGGIVFLGLNNLERIVKQTIRIFQLAKQNYFLFEYESQYRRLVPKIILEECLPMTGILTNERIEYKPPPDFRFYSTRGKVLFCQYDDGRFSDHRQALFTVPEHNHIPILNIFPLPDQLPSKPDHWVEMLQIASDLSKPFDFVRVDLYDLPDGVYFSEFTFTPNASFFPFQDKAFSRRLLEDVLLASGKKSGDTFVG